MTLQVIVETRTIPQFKLSYAPTAALVAAVPGAVDLAALRADIAALEQRIDDINNAKLPYTWWYALAATQAPTEGDFVGVSAVASSSRYVDLDAPTFTTDDMFGVFAVPLDAPEAQIVDAGLGLGDLLSPFSYRRLQAPLYISDIPYRAYVSRQHILAAADSGRRLRLVPQLRLSRYTRYAIATAGAAAPVFSAQWSMSDSPVVALGEWGGQDRYVHYLIPESIAAPTLVSRAVDGAANIASQFQDGALIQVGGESYRVRSTSAALQASDYSGQDLIILPERAGIEYYEAPTVLANMDLGYTWYAGFYSWARTAAHPDEPVADAFITAGAGVSQSTMDQIVMPTDMDGGVYAPDAANVYVRFVATPVGQDAIVGLYSVPAITYRALADIQAGAANWWANSWTEQPNNPVSIGGVDCNVFLNRRSTSQWSPGGLSGERLHAFR